VGLLDRKNQKFYHFTVNYPILKPFPVVTENRENLIISTQEGTLQEGYSYVYRKSVEVPKGSQKIIIKYELENKGTKTMDFDQYNHNHFLLGLPHPNTFLEIKCGQEFPGLPTNWLEQKENVLRLKGEFNEEGAFNLFHNTPIPIEKSRFVMNNTRDGISVNISEDFAPNRFLLYVSKIALCPEIFFRTQLPPGEKCSWQRTYEFNSK
jgi:hypothetical protein